MARSVLLIHGLGRSPLSLWMIQRALVEAGFTPIPLWYRSHVGRLENIADRLEGDIPAEGRIHAIGHSLGGLVARVLIGRLPEERRGRIVQLGSPNLGSPLAIHAQALHPLLGPILRDLEKGPGAASGLDIAAIAGTAAPAALGQVTGIKGPNDGVVSVESAHAAAPKALRRSYPVLHSFMMMDRRVISAAVNFLEEARESATG